MPSARSASVCNSPAATATPEFISLCLKRNWIDEFVFDNYSCLALTGFIMNRLIICQMLVLALTFAAPNRQAAVVEAVPAHATEAGRNIIRLLETYDVEAFANRMALTNTVDRKRVSNSARCVGARRPAWFDAWPRQIPSPRGAAKENPPTSGFSKSRPEAVLDAGNLDCFARRAHYQRPRRHQ